MASIKDLGSTIRAGSRPPLVPLRSCPRCGASYRAELDFCSLDGERLVSGGRDPMIGRLVGHGLIFEPIGEGGLGRVYRAGNIFLEQPIAVKVLFGDVAADRRAAERFRLEARAASSIHHENVVAVHDFGVTAEGLVFMVMEYLAGKTLAELVRREVRWSHQRTREILRQVARGLAASHARGLVHRDLKPANVMIVADPAGERAKILDFGLVSVVATGSEDPTRLSSTGQVFGTPSYMAPEQIAGEASDVRTDLYALGAILYELLSGRPPFLGDIQQVLNQHLTARPQPIPGAGSLGRLALQLLEKLPEHRLQSAEEVLEALDRSEGTLRPLEPLSFRELAADLEEDFEDDFDERLPRYGTGLVVAAGIIALLVGGAWLARDRLGIRLGTSAPVIVEATPTTAPPAPAPPAPVQEAYAEALRTPVVEPPPEPGPDAEAPPPPPPKQSAPRPDYERLMQEALDDAERAAREEMRLHPAPPIESLTPPIDGDDLIELED